MNEISNFAAQVVAEIKNYLPEEYKNASVEIKEVVKNNDKLLTGLLITKDGSNISPTIYLDGYFREYESGCRLLDNILEEVAEVRVAYEVGDRFDIGRIKSLDLAKDHILCKLVNAERNKDFLKGKPYTSVEDLVVVYYIDLGELDDGYATCVITDEVLAAYGITVGELHEIAMENLAKSHLKVKTMRESMIELLFPDGVPEGFPIEMILPPDDIPMRIITNERRLNGAVAILDPAIQEQISEMFGGDFVILPLNIHECIVTPMGGEIDPTEMAAFVSEVNGTQVLPEEVLSDHVYIYDRDTRMIMLAERYYG